MATARKQVMIRVEPDVAAKWTEIADARGVALNTFLIEAANASAAVGSLIPFASTTTGSASTATATFSSPPGMAVSGSTSADPLLAFDLAVSQTPMLSGLRKWVDPELLRSEFERLVKPE